MTFDRDHLLDMCDGDQAFEREVVESFLESAAGLIARMDQAAAAGDGAGLRAAAHGLKGSSLSIGGPDLGDACAALEASTTAAGSAATAGLLTRVRHEHQALVTALTGYLEGRDAAA